MAPTPPPKGSYGSGQGWRDVQPHLPDNKMERQIIAAIEGHEDEDGKPVESLLRATEDGPDRVSYAPRQYNTGPKGVREDARQAQAKAQLQRRADAARRAELSQRARGLVQPGEEDEDEDEDEEEDDSAFLQYRQQRLLELQRAAQARSYLPTYGALKELSVDEYLECINDANPDTFVVIHLCEPHLPACVHLNFRLQELARRFDQVCFGSLVVSQTKEVLGPNAVPESDLPALVAYRGGNTVGSEERVHDAIGERADLAALHSFVADMGVELTAAVAMKASEVAALQRYRETAGDDDHGDEDSDDD